MVMDSNDVHCRKSNKSCSSFESELLFLIARYLFKGPCQNAAKALVEDLQKFKLLPKKIDWLGNQHDQSYEELVRCYPHVGPEHLLKICTRVIPILDKEFPPSVKGVLSLLGAGKQSLLRDRRAVENPRRSLLQSLARRHGAPLGLPINSRPVNFVYLQLGRELSGSSSYSQFVPSSHYSKFKLLKRCVGHLSAVYCATYDKTGSLIITGADDSLVKVWSTLDGRLKATLRGASAEISDISINDQNTLVAAGSCDKIIRVWCLQTTALAAVLAGSSYITGVYFCPSVISRDSYLISTTGSGTVAFWTYSTKHKTFNPYPEQFHEKMRPGLAAIICASFSPGGMFLATGSADHNVRIYLMPDGVKRLNPSRVLEIDVHSDRVDSIQWCNRGLSFVSGSKDGTAIVWRFRRQQWDKMILRMSNNLKLKDNIEINNGKKVEVVNDNKQKLRVTMVGWSLDDKLVLTGVSDFSLKVWDSITGALVHILKGHTGEFYVIETHPIDPKIVLTTGHDGKLCIWDIKDGKMIVSHDNMIQGQGYGALFDTKWSPDGLQVVSTDSHGHICIYGAGSDEKFKMIPDELFFHTDYRPLIRDANHHVLDEQTQLAPHLMGPPFLVDIEGNPYPPDLQRLVPGRESCKEEQLIPNVVVNEDGETQVIDLAFSNGQDDMNTLSINHAGHSVLDEMIERLAQERGEINPTNRSTSRSSGRGANESDEQGISPTIRERLRRVSSRRSGDSDVRQSIGTSQPVALPSVFTKHKLIQPLNITSYKASVMMRKEHGEAEIKFYEEQNRLIPLVKEHEASSSKASRVNKNNRRTTSSRRSATIQLTDNAASNEAGPSRIESDDPESSLSDTSSSYYELESSEYSDWMGEQKMEPPTRKRTQRACNETHKRKSSRCKSKNGTQANETPSQVEDETCSSHEVPSIGTLPQPSETRRMNSRRKAQTQYNESGGWDEVPPAYRPPEWLGEVNPKKSPYFPQMGDEVIYFLQGHKLYLNAVKRKNLYKIETKDQPWAKLKLQEQELVKVIGIKYELRPPRLCCLKLAFINPETGNICSGNKFFTIKYHDIPDVIDFLVLKSMFDLSMSRVWQTGMKFGCMIEDDWWFGTVLQNEAVEPEYPDSPFLCYKVKWDNGEEERLSPWDMEVVENGEVPGDIFLYSPCEDEWPSDKDQTSECQRIADCISKIMELAIAEPFCAPVDLNMYPDYAKIVEYPMDLSLIKARVENQFYRRVTAIQFDARYIASNAEKFNRPDSTIVSNARVITDVLLEVIRDSNCYDVLPYYQTRMKDSKKPTPDKSNKTKTRRSPPNQTNVKKNRIRQCSKGWENRCRDLLMMLWESEDSEPFRSPVDSRLFRDYRRIVKQPMDLGTVRENLESSLYDSPLQFHEHMTLIFENSKKFNVDKKSEIYAITMRLSRMFEERIVSILRSWNCSAAPGFSEGTTRSSRSQTRPRRINYSNVRLRNRRRFGVSSNESQSESSEEVDAEEAEEDSDSKLTIRQANKIKVEIESNSSEVDEKESSSEVKPCSSGVKRAVNGHSVGEKYSGNIRFSRRTLSSEVNPISNPRKCETRNLRITSTTSQSASSDDSEDGSNSSPVSKSAIRTKAASRKYRNSRCVGSAPKNDNLRSFYSTRGVSNQRVSDKTNEECETKRTLRNRRISPALSSNESRKKRKISDSEDSSWCSSGPRKGKISSRRKIRRMLKEESEEEQSDDESDDDQSEDIEYAKENGNKAIDDEESPDEEYTETEMNNGEASEEDEEEEELYETENQGNRSESDGSDKVLYSLRSGYSLRKCRSTNARISSDEDGGRTASRGRSAEQTANMISTRSRNRFVRYQEYSTENYDNVHGRRLFSDTTSNRAPPPGLSKSSRGRLRKPSTRALALFE